MPRLTIPLDVSDAQLDALVRAAVLAGYSEPVVSVRQRREAAEWAIRRTIVGDQLCV